MRLEEYWGIGPKTAALLEEELGVESSIAAIEAADVRTLVDAGLSSGRATRILRRSRDEAGMAVLATGDARSVYRDLLTLIREFAVSRSAADSIRVLTPMLDRDQIVTRLTTVERALDTWRGLDEGERAGVLDAFERYDEMDGRARAAVETALALREVGATDGIFEPLASLPADDLRESAIALSHLEGDGVRRGADEELDRLRDAYEAADEMRADAMGVLDSIREADVRGSEEFREAYVEHVVGETGLDPAQVRESAPPEANDAADFVGGAIRTLAADLESTLDEREETVVSDLREDLEDAEGDVERAVEVVDDIALSLSLARFADAYDLVRPQIVENRTIAVAEARHLFLVARGESVQPVTYGIGDHGLTEVDAPPRGDRVSVLTGANSGGKTSLLETLCQVQVLAQMGLPVPAERAEVSIVDSVVFHRRHASFNAGVLESTLRTIVPPLTDAGRTLMLVDEFEAITEPGSAANLLHGLVNLTVERDALGVFVTHLADDLKPLPETARIDGIFAEGLNRDLELEVDYQPRFGQIGRSTPEFIVSRLVANASDREERAGFQTLATAVGEEAVQRTLLDAEWAG